METMALPLECNAYRIIITVQTYLFHDGKVVVFWLNKYTMYAYQTTKNLCGHGITNESRECFVGNHRPINPLTCSKEKT